MAETKPFNYVNVTTIVETANAQAAENGGSALVVILDHITDAGNLGAIARSAESGWGCRHRHPQQARGSRNGGDVQKLGQARFPTST